MQLYQKGIYYTHFFPGKWRVTVLLSKCYEEVLRGYTAKLLYQRLGKHLNQRHLHELYGVNILKQIKKSQEKCPCWRSALVTLPCDFIKMRLYHRRFPKYVSSFFRDSYFKNISEQVHVSSLHLLSELNNYCCGRDV